MAKPPLKSIREKCLDCSNGSTKHVKFCPITACALWSHRFGMRRETVKKEYGGKYLKPELMPDPTISLDDL